MGFKPEAAAGTAEKRRRFCPETVEPTGIGCTKTPRRRGMWITCDAAAGSMALRRREAGHSAEQIADQGQGKPGNS